ncbi:CoA-binding protein [Paradesulfitobacterium ferrireducens]|uniref:CoA-binding protein n=1 Tax=Paradesulfitobacterium ferrireducens TaxID=2816476 RepID=UPI001A90CAFD|nr:CoA-binding protein [Paradesulfitobacterium ferrireducens]
MAADMQEFLEQESWAVVGVSADPSKYGNKVYIQLKKAGYNVYGVNPNLDSVDGDKIYPDLGALPIVPDAVSLVVPPKVTEQVVNKCIELGIKRVWMQPGSESEAAIRNGEEHGIDVVYNQCVLIQTRDKI